MRFVENHIVPSLSFEHMCITARQRIGSDADVEMVLVVPTLPKFLATFRVSVVAKDLKTWQELLELHFPIQ